MSDAPKVTPLGDRVLVRVAKQKQVGKILLPDKHQKSMGRGEVLAVGPDCKKEDDSLMARRRIKPGMVVLFSEYAGHKVLDDDTLLLLPESELLGVLE